MTPTQTEAEAVRKLAERNGEARAAKLLGVDASTLARAAAAFRLRPATHDRIIRRLAELGSISRDAVTPNAG